VILEGIDLCFYAKKMLLQNNKLFFTEKHIHIEWQSTHDANKFEDIRRIFYYIVVAAACCLCTMI